MCDSVNFIDCDFEKIKYLIEAAKHSEKNLSLLNLFIVKI